MVVIKTYLIPNERMVKDEISAVNAYENTSSVVIIHYNYDPTLMKRANIGIPIFFNNNFKITLCM